MWHPETKGTATLVALRFVWPGVQKNNRTWARNLQSCQRSRVSRHTVTLLDKFAPPAVRFLHAHLDLLGLLPMSAGFTYCLTAVNRFTRWPEIIPIPDITANTVASALLTGQISYFSCPQTVTTEQKLRFESQYFHSNGQAMGIQISQKSAPPPHLTDSWNVSTGY
jgi:hypothetical protein